jgi:hypothetical protein
MKVLCVQIPHSESTRAAIGPFRHRHARSAKPNPYTDLEIPSLQLLSPSCAHVDALKRRRRKFSNQPSGNDPPTMPGPLPSLGSAFTLCRCPSVRNNR